MDPLNFSQFWNWDNPEGGKQGLQEVKHRRNAFTERENRVIFLLLGKWKFTLCRQLNWNHVLSCLVALVVRVFFFFPRMKPFSHWHYFALLKMLIWQRFPWRSTRERPAAGLGKGHKKQEEKKISNPFGKQLQPRQRNVETHQGRQRQQGQGWSPLLGLTADSACTSRIAKQMTQYKIKQLFKKSWVAAATVQCTPSKKKKNLTWASLLLLYISHVILKIILAWSFNNIRGESMQFKCTPDFAIFFPIGTHNG